MLPLESAIAPKLKACGFKKKARTWWRDKGEVVQVINLQKSEFGERLFVNVGVYLKRLGAETTPPANRCHIGARLERVAPHHHTEIASATADTEPSPTLVVAVTSDALSWLDGVSTLLGIKNYLASGGATKGLVFASVRQLVAEANDAFQETHSK